MDDVKKMFRTLVNGQKILTQKTAGNEKMIRAVINGQSALKQELLREAQKTRSELKKVENRLSLEIKENRSRIDTIGKSVAYLEDDTPTREEHDKLEKRVTKVEQTHPARAS